ncbi:hypothetical protein [Paenibacillus tuaregi]|uniref:hypothetical protein n=1 Tax=Paenibacillus tuaregi TaxID=1816681 RepID=UPI000837B54F|nr:hypothetical protein [Paenibacillus tuaregi]
MTQYLSRDNQVVYQAHPSMAQQLKYVKDNIRQICHSHLHRPVKVVMMDGSSHEGIIVNTDETFLYLSIAVPGDNRFLGFPGGPGSFYYNNTILPLVLYELLVISLLA